MERGQLFHSGEKSTEAREWGSCAGIKHFCVLSEAERSDFKSSLMMKSEAPRTSAITEQTFYGLNLICAADSI